MCALLAVLCGLLHTDRPQPQDHPRPPAAKYRALAQAQLAAHDYSKASQSFAKAADAYEALGDPNAAKVLREQSSRYATSISAFVRKSTAAASSNSTHRRLEPDSGCLFGVNVERDENARSPEEFNRLAGKSQSIFFIYARYGGRFPARYANQLKRIGAALEIAWEPTDLASVSDDRYLTDFAREASKAGIPIFLRFASEMNGDWTPYHRDPALYISKFRLVAEVMHRTADNVAMVWCPNETPEAAIPSYFPGDDAADWVGVNFYSVLYNDGDRAREASWRNPTDALRYVYDRYSAKHPVMIGEWAASHESVVDHMDRSDFAAEKIRLLYGALPRLFPRVKAVLWLSMNTEKYAAGSRRLNDFSLTDSPPVLKAYSEATSDDYYLAQYDRTAPTMYLALAPNLVLSGSEWLSYSARSYDPKSRIRMSFGKFKNIDLGPLGTTSIIADTTQLPNGPATLRLDVVDSQGKLAAQKNFQVLIRNSGAAIVR